MMQIGNSIYMPSRMYVGGTPRRRFSWMDGYAGIPYTFGR